jgi:hypothetical protein
MPDTYLPTTACRTDYSKSSTNAPKIENDVGERAECVESMPDSSNHDSQQSKFKCALCVKNRDLAMSEMRTFLGAEHRLCRRCVLAVDRNRA